MPNMPWRLYFIPATSRANAEEDNNTTIEISEVPKEIDIVFLAASVIMAIAILVIIAVYAFYFCFIDVRSKMYNNPASKMKCVRSVDSLASTGSTVVKTKIKIPISNRSSYLPKLASIYKKKASQSLYDKKSDRLSNFGPTEDEEATDSELNQARELKRDALDNLYEKVMKEEDKKTIESMIFDTE